MMAENDRASTEFPLCRENARLAVVILQLAVAVERNRSCGHIARLPVDSDQCSRNVTTLRQGGVPNVASGRGTDKFRQRAQYPGVAPRKNLFGSPVMRQPGVGKMLAG